MGPIAYMAGPCVLCLLQGTDQSKSQRKSVGRRGVGAGPSGEGPGDSLLEEVPSSLKKPVGIFPQRVEGHWRRGNSMAETSGKEGQLMWP